MRIQTNTAANNALRNLSNTDSAAERQIARLSSGFRINRSADDAAGMSIANKLRSDGRALQQAQRNASQATSVLQIADGAVDTISKIADRMKELAVQSGSSSVTDTDRTKIQAEFASLKSEITRITTNTKYQGSALLNGSFGVQNAGSGTLDATGGISNIQVSGAAASSTFTMAQTAATALTLSTGTSGTAGYVSQTITSSAGGAGVAQALNFDKLGISFTYTGTLGATTLNAKTVVTGASSSATFRVGTGANSDDEIAVSFNDLSLTGLGLTSSDVSTYAGGVAAITSIDAALTTISTAIGTIGAATNRLDYASSNVASLYQNVAAAESVIRDADMATEYTQFSKLQILQQAGTAMLAQANSSAQGVLQLLRG
jgi:flagellin